MISLGDTLAQLNRTDDLGNKIPFENLQFVTCSNREKKGGEVITLQNGVLSGHKMNMNTNAMINCKMPAGNHVAVNIHLITKFNNKEVFY